MAKIDDLVIFCAKCPWMLQKELFLMGFDARGEKGIEA